MIIEDCNCIQIPECDPIDCIYCQAGWSYKGELKK